MKINNIYIQIDELNNSLNKLLLNKKCFDKNGIKCIESISNKLKSIL